MRRPNANEAVLYEALQLAKEYIAAEGTGKERPERKTVLKRIRAALAPKKNVYKQRVVLLENLLTEIRELESEMNSASYWAAWYGRDRKTKKLDEYYREIYRIVRRISNIADKLRL